MKTVGLFDEASEFESQFFRQLKGNPRTVKFTEIFGCVTATYYKGIRADGRPAMIKEEGVFDELREQDKVRILTPNEVEFLQGLPADYTAGISNTQRYKSLGNSFTLDVIEHITKGIK